MANKDSWKRWSYRAAIVVLIVMLLSGIALLVVGPSLKVKYLSLFALGMPIVGFLSLWGAPHIHARMQYRRMPSAQTSVTMTVSEPGLRVLFEYGDSQVKWSAYIGWAEGAAVFVLFPQPRLYVPIPKRAFSPDQLDQFRDILRRNVGKK